MPKFVELMFKAIKSNDLDFVLRNMVHSHKKPGVYIQDEYGFFDSFPRLNYIDIGNYIVKTKIARETGFINKEFAADGVFADEILREYKGKIRTGKIENVLFAHN